MANGMATETAAQRPIPKAPGYLASALRVFDLSVERDAVVAADDLHGARGRRAGADLASCCACSTRSARRSSASTASRMAGPAIFGLMIWVFYLRFTVPVLGVFYGTSLIADEVEDKTITYLFTRPIPKGRRAGREVPGLPGLHGLRRAAVGRHRLPADRADAGQPRRRRSWTCSRTWRCWRSGWRSTGRCSPSSAPGSSGRCWSG